MDPQNNEALQRILEKLEAIEDHLDNLDLRLEALEGEWLAGSVPAPQAPQAPTIPPSPPAPIGLTPAPVTPTSIDDVLSHNTPVEPGLPPAPLSPIPTPPRSPVADVAPSLTSHEPTSPTASTTSASPDDVAASDTTPTTGPKTSAPAPDPTAKFRQAVAGLRPGTVPSQPKESWEVRIATTWLPRIGLFFLALVCLLFAKEYTQGPLGKIIATYATALALIGVGLWKEKKYPQWARPVMAGGLAFSYFASYAMGFVEPMRLLDSLSTKLVILGTNLVIIFGVAHWKKSEVIGGTALILGYLTTGVVGNDVAAFSSSLALSVAALLFLWLNQWFAATALACGATYLAHFYVWRFVPEAEIRAPHEAFWHHFLFLSLYFTVFTVAALTGKRAARDESEHHRDKSTMFSRPIQTLSRHNILTALTYTNVVAYVVGMITLLKLTNVYWDEAWLFLLPMAAVLGVLGLLFAGFATIQMTYLVAATLCLTLGLIAAVSPMWLPIFLALQGLGMIIAARGRYAELWRDLSLIVIGYACAFVVTGGAADVLRISTTEIINFPWWTHAAVTAISLAYAVTWERRFGSLTTGLAPAGHFLVTFVAVIVWAVALHDEPAAHGFLYHAAAIPLVALAAVFARAKSLTIFVFGTILVAALNWPGFGALSRGDANNQYWAAAISLAGIAAGLLAEKRGTGDLSYNRWLWRALYSWSQFLLCVSIYWLCGKATETAVLTALFAATIAAAWFLQSAALGKSAFIVAIFILGSTGYRETILIPLAAVVAAVAYPMGLAQWTIRTGDTSPWITRWGQAAVIAITGIMVIMSTSALDWNLPLTLGAFALFAALYAASGRFTPVITVVLLCTVGIFMLLASRLGGELRYRYSEEGPAAATAAYSLLGVFLLVAAERVLAFAPRINIPFLKVGNASYVTAHNSFPAETDMLEASSQSQTAQLHPGLYPSARSSTFGWLLPTTQSLLTSSLALATLVMAVMALRTLPDLRLFYFTGAMVAAAFIWIVFGFWFNEGAYRKAGFILLCIGIVKGLIWDVLSLKQTFYRIVSWSILGLLAIAASFLYTRFKSRLTNTEGE